MRVGIRLLLALRVGRRVAIVVGHVFRNDHGELDEPFHLAVLAPRGLVNEFSLPFFRYGVYVGSPLKELLDDCVRAFIMAMAYLFPYQRLRGAVGVNRPGFFVKEYEVTLGVSDCNRDVEAVKDVC